MNYRSIFTAMPIAAFAVLAAACPAEEDVTAEEAQEAVVEASLASQASNVAEGTIEIGTTFTLGQAVEDAAEEIRAFAESQLPCADVAREGATVSITYGANGACEFHGRSFTGTHSVTVSRNEENDVLVHHEWDDVSNGRVSVDGTADVTWSQDDKSRHVIHELTWTRLSDGRTGTGTGDRVQSPLDGSWQNGVAIDGERAWEGERGRWDLDIDGVEWRWVDPVPESGTYTLTTPANKVITLTFERADEDTIHVTVTGGRRDHEFNVTSLGEVEE
ncbi:MAG: hypothetical protein IPM79_39430 [Polyangiaceae bacterium]|nr:hypothetical protein [Polyangiaceae bacterium]